MSIVVDMTKKAAVRFGATGLDQLVQEVRTVLSTRKGSVPLDRDFGLSWDIVDMPVSAAGPRCIAEIGRQLEKHVPRIKVETVAFKPSDFGDGILKPVVTVSVREEYRHEL